jgi:hypothetical protein
VSPAPGQALALGKPATVWGWAWADGGVSAVDVNADDGTGWTAAAVEPQAGRAWQRFTATWAPAQRGRYELSARARSADGRSQPLSGTRNAIHSVAVDIVAAD